MVRWGLLGTAKIATERVVPAMQRCRHARVIAISSRSLRQARAVAASLNIPRAYEGYDGLLADRDVDAVYIPLPNHLHVPWTLRALEAGKHVLCEKPIGVSASDARPLLAARDRAGRVVQEAFMIRWHPQWLAALSSVLKGQLGEVRRVDGRFSYRNLDPENIRNQVQLGGGGLLDIGCYLVHVSRWLLGRQPVGLRASITSDPVMKIDCAGDFVLDFMGATATGTYGTQRDPDQGVEIHGSRASFVIEVPFNAPVNRPCRATFTPTNGSAQSLSFDVCDQYTLQGDEVSCAILEGRAAPYPLEDSIANMEVIDAIFAAS